MLNSCTVGSNSSIGWSAEVMHTSRSKISHYHIGDWSTVWAYSIISTHIPENHILTNTGRILKKQRSLDWVNSD
jgi:carbonic anhydrase/acetyltransferase-like protein (isoleucine patch superfamily)